MKKYLVGIMFDNTIHLIDVKANCKREAYMTAKIKLADILFKMKNLKNYSCDVFPD